QQIPGDAEFVHHHDRARRRRHDVRPRVDVAEQLPRPRLSLCDHAEFVADGVHGREVVKTGGAYAHALRIITTRTTDERCAPTRLCGLATGSTDDSEVV